jgi:hypothetical protein
MKGQRTHPGAEAIADCVGGVRTWRARRVAAHIAGCPSCSAMGRQLGQVSAVLAAVPPPPLPGDVARRLDAALATEVAARVASGSTLPETSVPAAVPSGSSAVPPESVVLPPGSVRPDGQRPRRRPSGSPRWRVPRPVPVLTALACLVLAGGGYLISQSGKPSAVSANSAAGSAAQAQRQPRHTGAAFRPGFIEGPAYNVRSTNTDYLTATLRAQALSELSSPAPSKGTPLSPASSSALQGCVMEVAGNDTPSFVDLARYQGRPATIIVARDHAWVTSRGCNATQHGVLDSVSLSGG